MSFTPGIPASGQSLGNSRTQVLNNFSSLRTTNAVNHYDVNDALAGKHKFLQMPQQGSGPATTATEIGLYCKAVAGTSRLFLRQQSSGTEIQLSNIDPALTTSGGSTEVRTFLPGNFLMYSGTASVAVGVAGTFNFLNGAFPTAIYSCIAVPVGNGTVTPGFSLVSFNTSSFTFNKNNLLVTIAYFAIGR